MVHQKFYLQKANLPKKKVLFCTLAVQVVEVDTLQTI
jgi:hypothetical protein